MRNNNQLASLFEQVIHRFNISLAMRHINCSHVVTVSVGCRENGCAYDDDPVTTKVIHLHMDGKRQHNACCIQYRGK